METMLDSALVSAAMMNGSESGFGLWCEEIGRLFDESLGELRRPYISTRGFTPLHEVLLAISRSVTLEEFLYSSSQAGTLENIINLVDSHYRTALAWAVEFG